MSNDLILMLQGAAGLYILQLLQAKLAEILADQELTRIRELIVAKHIKTTAELTVAADKAIRTQGATLYFLTHAQTKKLHEDILTLIRVCKARLDLESTSSLLKIMSDYTKDDKGGNGDGKPSA